MWCLYIRVGLHLHRINNNNEKNLQDGLVGFTQSWSTWVIGHMHICISLIPQWEGRSILLLIGEAGKTIYLCVSFSLPLKGRKYYLLSISDRSS